MKNLISILMPVKNAANLVTLTLESIEKQTFSNWELIAVDDNSNDSTLQILELWQSKNPKIIVFKNNGNGIIDALKLAYKNCNGNFITRMDADDLMDFSKLEMLYEKLKSEKENTIVTAYVKYFTSDENGIKDGYLKYEKWLNNLTKAENNFSEIYKECVIPSPCWMIRKTDFEKCGAFNSEIYPEDYDLCFRFYEQKLKVITVKKVLHYWRDHKNRTSRTSENYADNRFLELKLHYFLKLDYHKNKNLFIWGTGKKGKWISKYLIEKQISFSWITNNNKKIGLNIYGKIIKSYQKITSENKSELQIIIAVANKTEQEEIKDFLVENEVDLGNVFWFC